MTKIRIATSAFALLVVSFAMVGSSNAQGLPMQDSPGTSSQTRNLGNFNDDSWKNTNLGGGWSNFSNGGRQQVRQPVRQKQPVLVWSTTAYSNQAHPIVMDLRRQGYHVTWRNRVIPYNFRTVYVTDIYAYAYR